MTKYVLGHSGKELDIAIAKVLSGYILPEDDINITANGEYDVTEFAKANVNVPVPDGYINLSEIINHCSRYTSGSYTPTANTVLDNIQISIQDENGKFKPKVFILVHLSRIENNGTHTASIPVTSTVTVTDDEGNIIFSRANGIYYNSSVGACSNQSGSRYFSPADGSVQGIASDFYMQSGKQYSWYAWG